MTPSRTGIKFWHFADLHLDAHAECCRPWPCRGCILRSVLSALRVEMERRPPHIVLLAGDISNLGAAKSDEIRQAAAPLQALIDAAQSRGVGVVGVTR